MLDVSITIGDCFIIGAVTSLFILGFARIGWFPALFVTIEKEEEN